MRRYFVSYTYFTGSWRRIFNSCVLVSGTKLTDETVLRLHDTLKDTLSGLMYELAIVNIIPLDD